MTCRIAHILDGFLHGANIFGCNMNEYDLSQKKFTFIDGTSYIADCRLDLIPGFNSTRISKNVWQRGDCTKGGTFVTFCVVHFKLDTVCIMYKGVYYPSQQAKVRLVSCGILRFGVALSVAVLFVFNINYYLLFVFTIYTNKYK